MNSKSYFSFLLVGLLASTAMRVDAQKNDSSSVSLTVQQAIDYINSSAKA